MAQERESPWLLRFEIEADHLAIRSNTPDLGQACEELAVRLDGEPLTIAFNGRYLLDALTNVSGEEIRLFLNEPLSMAMLRPVGTDDMLSLLMPVRAKDVKPAAG